VRGLSALPPGSSPRTPGPVRDRIESARTSLHLTSVKTLLDRPQSVFVRRALFQVHLWVGVATGLYLFVVCVTGAALVFRIDMQRALHPDLFTPRVEGPPANPADVMETVNREYPGERVSGVDAPTTARPTYLAYATSAIGSARCCSIP
jgi:hypothetical protein